VNEHVKPVYLNESLSTEAEVYLVLMEDVLRYITDTSEVLIPFAGLPFIFVSA
jgi:hypothetical protein